MIEILKLLIGVGVLILGHPIGNLLAKYTKEELKDGQKYFLIIVWAGFIGGFIGLIIGKDVLLFSMFFISIVTSRSLVKERKSKKK